MNKTNQEILDDFNRQSDEIKALAQRRLKVLKNLQINLLDFINIWNGPECIDIMKEIAPKIKGILNNEKHNVVDTLVVMAAAMEVELRIPIDGLSMIPEGKVN